MAEMSTPTNEKPRKSRVEVVIRCRPILTKESGEKQESVVDLNEPEGQVIVALEKTFAFDACFSSDVTQEDIYKNVALDPVQNFARNAENNATILAYGQTGAGKTFTMLGQNSEKGIIHRALEDIFRICDPETDSIGVAFYEIHNEKVFDLLSQSSLKVPLLLREENGGEFYLPQLKQHWTDSFGDALNLLEKGLKTRSIGSTASNLNSSRSHAIFRVTISRIDGEERKEAKLSLVDLAGSESVRKTNAIGDRLTEANNINKGLLALGNCVSDICAGKGHIPFRNSTLTKVLRECLHGEGHTTMIACISPTEADLSETLNTLRYANRAKNMQKPPIPKHLLQFSSAKKRKFASLVIPPTPAKFMKMNNTVNIGAANLTPLKKMATPKMNKTLPASSTSMKKVPIFCDSSLGNISENDEEEKLSDISSIYPNSMASSTSKVSNMTLLDATSLSPIIRRVLKEQQDQFMQRLEETLLVAPGKKEEKLETFLADETLISGPAFPAARQKMREILDDNHQPDGDEEDLITSKPLGSALRDVTNAERMRRKSAHKEAVEKTASPNLCTKSLEGKENDEISRMAKEMGISSPLLMFGDDDDSNRLRSVKKVPKRSSRRTTMLPPELNKTLNESFKDRRRSSRLEALQKFKNPLEVKTNWQVFDQSKHNENILSMLNSANLQMLQKIPAIGPKTAFLIHSQREMRGKFESLETLKSIPGLQKSFFNKFLKTHQVVL